MIERRRISIGPGVTPDFFGAWDLNQQELCSQIIDFFEQNKNLQKPGKTAGNLIDPEIKNSIDLKIEPKYLNSEGYDSFNSYFDELHKMFKDYCNQWNFLKTFVKIMHIGNFNIQKYEKGGHFSKVHSERTGLTTLHRILVWMTYLNDINEGGETEFPHFNLKIKPAQGKTLIWPAEWTHAHRGCPVLDQPKYIITGWFHLPYES